MLKWVGVWLCLGVGIANAGSATANLTVSTTVVASCSISAGTLTFPNYNTVTGTQVDGQGTLSVACSRGATTSIQLGQGQNPTLSSTDAVPLRQMKNGTSYLGYTLYSDSSRLVPWGNTALTGWVYVPATSAQTNVTVYGRVTASQDVPAGTYTDTVLATITF